MSASHSTQPTNNNRQARTYAQCGRELLKPDIDIGESVNQAFSSGNICPRPRVARMGHDHKTDAIIFDLFYEVFPKQKWACFLNENKKFLKRKFFYLENIYKTSIIFFVFETFSLFFQKNARNKNSLGWHAWATIEL